MMSPEAASNAYGVVASDEKPRCWRCGKLLAEEVTRPWTITCVRCKATNMRES
jgi:exosome complex RNA-binding protein Csl4